MQIGVTYPQLELGADPAAIRDFAQAAEQAGFDYLLAYDHVLGADPSKHELSGPYTHESLFHEPFVLFGYLAGLTERIELVTGIIILPQRQTALVAKQAAEVDVLSGGRLTLGIGIGWNQVEYEGLGQDFRTRGRRSEEQVQLIRRLWEEPLVTFEGDFDTSRDAGISLIGRAEAGLGPVEHQLGQAAAWQDSGATHVTLNTMNAGFTTPQQHIDAITAFAEAYRRDA